MPQYPAHPVGRLATAGLLAAYFVVAVWGADILGAGNAPAPLIWPASGIGLVLILVRGIRTWPLILAVAVLAAMLTLYNGDSTLEQVGAALLSGVAATLEAVLGAWLIWRFTGEAYLERADSFLLAMLIAAPAACFVSAVPLVLGNLLEGVVTTHTWVGAFATWHAAAVSNWMGVLVLAPPVALWLARMRVELDLREAGELLALSSVAASVFLMPAPEQARYLLVAAHLGIAMRVPVKWAATAVALTSIAYLSMRTFSLRTLPAADAYLFFLREVVFTFILNITTYVTALLHREAEERRLRAEDLARELSDAERRERHRIAQILHDHLQQLLVAAGMAVGRLRNGDETAGAHAEQLIRDAISDARTLSVELHPPVLNELGLTAAMQWLSEESEQRHGLKVHFESDDSPNAERPEIASFVLQATGELLLNVVKHSGGDTAWLRLRRGARWLEVEVEDYGHGCGKREFAKSEGGHFGLSSIRQRVELLGGRFELSTQSGCWIRLRLPLEQGKRRRGLWRRRIARASRRKSS